MQRSGNVVAIELSIVSQSVGRQHGMVVVRQGNPRPRCHSCHLHVVAILLLVLLLGIVAKEIIVRTLMRDVGHHGNHRIEQYLEVGLGILYRVGSDGRCQVTAGRESHYSHLVGADVPSGSVASDESHCLLGVAYGHLPVTMRHAVLEHHRCNALLCEELSPVLALVVESQVVVSAARTYNHGASCCLRFLGKIHPDFSRVCHVGALLLGRSCPEVHFQRLTRRYCEARRCCNSCHYQLSYVHNLCIFADKGSNKKAIIKNPKT